MKDGKYHVGQKTPSRMVLVCPYQIAMPLNRIVMPLNRIIMLLNRIIMLLNRIIMPLNRIVMPTTVESARNRFHVRAHTLDINLGVVA